MAIIVDKEQKRRDIACACTDILLQKGIKQITISEIAKAAGIGKGTVYEYFSHKEDIVFEIITVVIEEYLIELESITKEKSSLKSRLIHFLHLIFVNEQSEMMLALYREFLAILLSSGSDEMRAFATTCRKRFSTILDAMILQAVDEGEVDNTFKGASSLILTYFSGLILDTHILQLDAKMQIEQFVDMLLKGVVCKS